MSSYLIYEFILIPSVYCFFFIYLISFMVVIGREDWFLIWVGLEINIMSFLLLVYKRYRIMIGESCLRYFFIQRISSSLFIGIFYLDYYIISGIILIILRLKIGAGPFFFWFPSLCSGVDWISCFFLILFQRILPLVLIFIFIHWVIWIIIIIRLFIGVLGSFNQINLKQLLAYSSVNHLGWILIIGILKGIVWIVYLILYGFVLWRVIILILKDNIINISIIYLSKYKLVFIIRILRIGGVPPLLGFFLKWMAFINILIIRKVFLLILIVVSIVILYIYIRVVYDVFLVGVDRWCNRWGYNFYFDNSEIIRIVGILIGVIMFIYLY